VPGYAAPQDTVGPASRRFLVIAAIIRDGQQSGALAPPGGTLAPASDPLAWSGTHAPSGGTHAPSGLHAPSGGTLAPSGGTLAPASDPLAPSGGPLAPSGRTLGSADAPLAPSWGPPIPAPLLAELNGVAAALGVEADAGLTARTLVAVTELFGALNFELFGQLNNTIDERRAWFDYQARAMAALIGFP